MKTLSLKIEYKKTDELIPYKNNAKSHPDEQIDQIVTSIKEFGFNDPIAVDKGNVIIEGHGRLMACKKLGIEDVPVIKLDHLTEAEKKAYILAHNKITMNSGFDEDVLKLELIEIEEQIGIDISDLGLDFDFDIDELDDEEFEPVLQSGDRDPIRNMTFTVSDEQHELIEEVIKQAKNFNPTDPAGINENSNGNSLYYICEFFKNKVE
jgi:hypothetical protein